MLDYREIAARSLIGRARGREPPYSWLYARLYACLYAHIIITYKVCLLTESLGEREREPPEPPFAE